MSVQNALALDHFYIDLAPSDFESLTELTKILRAARHNVVKAADDSWEGIYIRSRPQSYFEILKDRRFGGLGICFAPIMSCCIDTSVIIDEMPHEKWIVGTRSRDDGQKWFDHISTGDYLNQGDTFFNAWIMKYHQTHFDQLTGREICYHLHC